MKNFSLIELLVAIAIVGVLMGIMMPYLEGMMNDGYETKAKTHLLFLRDQIKRFRIEQGRWPRSIDELCVPIESKDPMTNFLADTMKNKKVKYIDEETAEVSIDPWHNPYMLMSKRCFKNFLGVLVTGPVPMPPYYTPFTVWVGCQSDEYLEDVRNSKWIFVGEERIPGIEPDIYVE